MTYKTLEEAAAAMRAFADEREWDRFHTPKNLAAAMSVEAAEVLEHFQWLTEAESKALPPEKRDAVALELADVFLYLVRLSDRLGIDLLEVAKRKMALNAVKYPAGSNQGQIRKSGSDPDFDRA